MTMTITANRPPRHLHRTAMETLDVFGPSGSEGHWYKTHFHPGVLKVRSKSHCAFFWHKMNKGIVQHESLVPPAGVVLEKL